MIGTTPVVLEIPSRKDVAITIEKEGYKPATVNLESRWQWGMMFWGILAYVVPFAVDLATGAIWQHNDKLVAVHLEPSSTTTD